MSIAEGVCSLSLPSGGLRPASRCTKWSWRRVWPSESPDMIWKVKPLHPLRWTYSWNRIDPTSCLLFCQMWSAVITAAKVEHRFWALVQMVKKDCAFLASDYLGREADHWGQAHPSHIFPLLLWSPQTRHQKWNPYASLKKQSKEEVVGGMLQKSNPHYLFMEAATPLSLSGHSRSRGIQGRASHLDFRVSKTAVPLTVGHQKSMQHPSWKKWSTFHCHELGGIISSKKIQPTKARCQPPSADGLSPWRDLQLLMWWPCGTWGTGAAAGNVGSRGKPRGHRAPRPQLGGARDKWDTSRRCRLRLWCYAQGWWRSHRQRSILHLLLQCNRRRH